MWPVMMLATAAVVDTGLGKLPRAAYAISLAIIVAALAFNGIRSAASRSTFALGRGERRYIDVARFIADHTEPDAVVLGLQHTGSLRVYAGRLTMKYDVLEPAWPARAVEFLPSNGRQQYFVLA